jgi:hypothetical protein
MGAVSIARGAEQAPKEQCVGHPLGLTGDNLSHINVANLRDLRTVSNQMRLVLVFLVASAMVCRGEDKATGRWEGVVNVPDHEFTVVVDLQPAEGGSWRGSVIIPGLNIKGVPLSDITVNNSNASFTIKGSRGLDATFKGSFGADGTFAGDYAQGENRAPFALKRTGPPQVDTPPGSTSVAREIEGEWNGEYSIFGAPRHVTLKLMNGESGATAELVVVGKKVNNLPVDLITQEGDLLTIDSHQTGITYEGQFDKNANEIKGTFMQGPIELPLLLHRSK